MSLKDALTKAGYKSTKSENFRESAKGKNRKDSEIHQHSRNFCEHCSTVQPDVEHYKHRNPTTEAEWMCAACADRLMIHDQFRVTEQSDFSKKKMFRREYGETLSLAKKEVHSRNKTPNKRVDGNRPHQKTAKRPKDGNGNY